MRYEYFALFFCQEWTDERLRWDPAEYSNLPYFVVPPTDVWLPTFVLENE